MFCKIEIFILSSLLNRILSVRLVSIGSVGRLVGGRLVGGLVSKWSVVGGSVFGGLDKTPTGAERTPSLCGNTISTHSRTLSYLCLRYLSRLFIYSGRNY